MEEFGFDRGQDLMGVAANGLATDRAFGAPGDLRSPPSLDLFGWNGALGIIEASESLIDRQPKGFGKELARLFTLE